MTNFTITLPTDPAEALWEINRLILLSALASALVGIPDTDEQPIRVPFRPSGFAASALVALMGSSADTVESRDGHWVHTIRPATENEKESEKS